jgi:Protein of unknown function (DUF2510)
MSPMALTGPTVPERAGRLPQPRRADFVARTVVAGMLAGFVGGAVLGWSKTDGSLESPVLFIVLGLMVGAAAGGALAAAVELVRTWAAWSHKPARVPPPRAEVVDLAGIPLPAHDDGAPPPGWYADPAGGDAMRFWDGAAWTEHVWRRRRARVAR